MCSSEVEPPPGALGARLDCAIFSVELCGADCAVDGGSIDLAAGV